MTDNERAAPKPPATSARPGTAAPVAKASPPAVSTDYLLLFGD